MLPVEDYSSVLWSYRLPAGMAYEPLHDKLKEQGFVIYAGQGHLDAEIFRIAHMGEIRTADLDDLTTAFQSAIAGP